MSIKGFPTQKKIAAAIDGYTELQSRASSEYATIQPSKDDRNGLDVVARFGCLIASDTIETGSTTRVIKATAHVAVKGDFIRITQAGANQYIEMAVISVPSANYMILAGELLATPSNGDTFEIKRFITPTLDAATGSINTTAAAIKFSRDSVDTTVTEDTTTPSNNRPLPVKNYGLSKVDNKRHNYASVNVTDSAYVQLIASTTGKSNFLTLFDSGGYAMVIAFGAAASEVDKLYIPPGGFNGVIPFYIPASTRLSVKCLESSTTVALGMMLFNTLE